MAAGGVDPDEDVRLVVLPPPYMVDSLASGHVDGFCVGAPWNSVAVELGIGRILHFGSDIVARDAEKVLAVRSRWAAEHPDVVARLVRAHDRAAGFIADPRNGEEVAELLAGPGRVEVEADFLRRTLEGRLKLARDSATRTDRHYLVIGREGASRPNPIMLRGPTRRWCDGARPTCHRTCLRRHRACSARITTMPRLAAPARQSRRTRRAMQSAPSPVLRSMPATWPAICRLGRSRGTGPPRRRHPLGGLPATPAIAAGVSAIVLSAVRAGTSKTGPIY